MKLQRSTLALLLLALGIGGGALWLETRKIPQQLAEKANQNLLFPFSKDEIQALTVQLNQPSSEVKDVKVPATYRFEKVNIEGDKSRLSPWQLKQPEDVPANDAYIFYLVDLLVQSKRDRTFSATPSQLAEYGLDKPQARVEVKLRNNQTHQLLLGKADFNRSKLYAIPNPPQDPSKPVDVVLVPIDFEYGVYRPLSDWKANNNPSSETQSQPTPSPE